LATSVMPRARARFPRAWSSADGPFFSKTTVRYDLVTPFRGVTHCYRTLRGLPASPARGAGRQGVRNTAERCYEKDPTSFTVIPAGCRNPGPWTAVSGPCRHVRSPPLRQKMCRRLLRPPWYWVPASWRDDRLRCRGPRLLRRSDA
jgi:hypothetical protein